MTKQIMPKQVPTKRQVAKWERQNRIRRIIIIASTVFLIGIISYVGGGYYNGQIKPFNEKVITVNDVSFDMRYYINMLDAYTKVQGIETNDTYYYADMAAQYIEESELLRQGSGELYITVSEAEIMGIITNMGVPNSRAYRDIAEIELMRDKFMEYFNSELPDELLQTHLQMILAESEDVASKVIDRATNGENFTELVREFSYDNTTKAYDGYAGWLPEELVPPYLAEAFNLTPGEISQPIYDNSTSKDVGYWLIMVNETDPERGIDVSAMLLGSEQEALEVKDELDAGSDFGELSGNYSQHNSKYRSGEVGWLNANKTNDFSDAFNEVVFQLPTGQVSEPVKDETVQTTGGYWIVKTLDKQQRELGDELKEILKNKHYSDWVELHKGNSTIENKLDIDKKSWAVEKVIKGR